MTLIKRDTRAISTQALLVKALDRIGEDLSHVQPVERAAVLAGALLESLTIDGNANEVQLIVIAHTVQTARLQEWRSSAGTVLVGIDPSGTIVIGDITPNNTATTQEVLAAGGVEGKNAAAAVKTFTNTATQRAEFQMERGRGTIASPLAVALNDYLGTLSFVGWSTNLSSGRAIPAQVAAIVDGTVASGSIPTKLAFITGSSAGTRVEGLNVSSSQNVYAGGSTAAHSKLQSAGAIATPYAAKTAAYTLTATDSVIAADATGGAFTLTLPTAVGITGREYKIMRTNSGANAVTIDGNGAETINGAATYSLSAQWQGVTLVSTGAAWLAF